MYQIFTVTLVSPNTIFERCLVSQFNCAAIGYVHYIKR